MARTGTLPILNGESGLSRYLAEIRKFPMLEPQQEYMLAKRWREHDDRDAAHKLVTSHLRLVAKIAMGYRGYGLPISEVVSEGNVGLMQAVKRFEPDKGFRLATYAMWWIKASIQEYILRSWSLVKMGTTANQKKLFFNLRKAKSRISALDEGDLHPDQVKLIAKRLGVTDQDVVDMNRRLGGDASLNAPIRDDGEAGEWQDWLVDTSPSQEALMADHEEYDHRREALERRDRRAQPARTPHLRGAPPRRRADDAGRSGGRIRRVARTRAADRGPRLREGAVRGQGRDRSPGSGHAGSRALISRRATSDDKSRRQRRLFCWRWSRLPARGGPSIFRVKSAEIVRQRGGIAARALPQRLAAQQHAGLGLVIRRHIVGRLQRLAEDLAVPVIGLLGADEDADAMLRFGIKITQGFASPVYDEAVRRQRAQRFLPSRIVGDLDHENRQTTDKNCSFPGTACSAAPRRPEPRRRATARRPETGARPRCHGAEMVADGRLRPAR